MRGVAETTMPADGLHSVVGRTVLVVEDEALVALNLEDMLNDLGCSVVGPAMRIAKALDMAALPGLDVAILDVNLAGTPVYPVAEALRTRGVPLVFATGYGRSGLPAEWHAFPILQKPYTADEVLAAMRQAMAA